MLAVTAVIVEKMCFYLLFNFLYSAGSAPQTSHGRGNFSPTLLFDGPGCVNNALINAFKKLTQCVSAF